MANLARLSSVVEWLKFPAALHWGNPLHDPKRVLQVAGNRVQPNRGPLRTAKRS